MRRIGSDLVLLLLIICLGVGFSSYWTQVFSPLRDVVDIDLSLWHLPEYTFYSLSRGLLAYALSLIFSLLWGFWAAKDRVVEKAVIPILDVLQSIPFLGFLPGVVLLLVGIFRHNNVGLELAAILLMFTSQVWNMAFGVYHSIRTVPAEKSECATAYHFSPFQRVRWVELPFTMLSLIWNSIMSVAGGWFFLMINEAYKLGTRDFRLPGLGSYMSVAASKGDVPAMIHAGVAMILMIVFLDQFLWRPLVVWSQKFRVEETGPQGLTEAWFLTVVKHSYIIAFFHSLSRRIGGYIQDRRRNVSFNYFPILSRAALLLLLALLSVALFFAIRLMKDVSLDQWLYLGTMLCLTFGRVMICVGLSVLIMLPLGLAIGLSDKWNRSLQPIIQVAASFPATLLFPALIVLFKIVGIPLGIGSIILMLMGTQWYVLFNVMAGAKAMPSDLKEVAKSFRFNRAHRFLWLYLPAVFPYLITGILSAAGGAWNASIVSEYATYKDQVWMTPGIGSSISLAAQENDFPLLAASIAVLVVVVILLNYQVWLRLYHYSEKRFALNG